MNVLYCLEHHCQSYCSHVFLHMMVNVDSLQSIVRICDIIILTHVVYKLLIPEMWVLNFQ